jgi:hypothetical protein
MKAMAQAPHGSGAEEVSMATTSVVAMDARCPLCGSPILSFGQGGRVVAEDLHAVPLHRWGGAGEGYMVCDDCGVLAELSADLTLN